MGCKLEDHKDLLSVWTTMLSSMQVPMFLSTLLAKCNTSLRSRKKWCHANACVRVQHSHGRSRFGRHDECSVAHLSGHRLYLTIFRQIVHIAVNNAWFSIAVMGQKHQLLKIFGLKMTHLSWKAEKRKQLHRIRKPTKRQKLTRPLDDTGYDGIGLMQDVPEWTDVSHGPEVQRTFMHCRSRPGPARSYWRYGCFCFDQSNQVCSVEHDAFRFMLNLKITVKRQKWLKCFV